MPEDIDAQFREIDEQGNPKGPLWKNEICEEAAESGRLNRFPHGLKAVVLSSSLKIRF